MEKSVIELKQEKKILLERRDTMQEAIKSLRTLYPVGVDNRVDSLVVELEIDIKESCKTRDKIEKEIKKIQDICSHNWEYEGHDSHNDYYKCTKCGYER